MKRSVEEKMTYFEATEAALDDGFKKWIYRWIKKPENWCRLNAEEQAHVEKRARRLGLAEPEKP